MKNPFVLLLALIILQGLFINSISTFAASAVEVGVVVTPNPTATKFLYPNRDTAIAWFDIDMSKPKQLSSLQVLISSGYCPVVKFGKVSVYVYTTERFLVATQSVLPLENDREGRISLASLTSLLPSGKHSLWLAVEKLPQGLVTGDTIKTVIEEIHFDDTDLKNPQTILGVETFATVRGLHPKIEVYIEPEGPNRGNTVLRAIGVPEQVYQLRSSSDLSAWVTDNKRWTNGLGQVAIDVGRHADGLQFYTLVVLP